MWSQSSLGQLEQEPRLWNELSKVWFSLTGIWVRIRTLDIEFVLFTCCMKVCSFNINPIDSIELLKESLIFLQVHCFDDGLREAHLNIFYTRILCWRK